MEYKLNNKIVFFNPTFGFAKVCFIFNYGKFIPVLYLKKTTSDILVCPMLQG